MFHTIASSTRMIAETRREYGLRGLLRHGRAAAEYLVTLRDHPKPNEFDQPQVDYLPLVWPDLPPSLDGLRIVQLSDLHVCSWMPLYLLHRAAQLAMAQHPDLIVLTGDYISHDRYADRYARIAAEGMADLQAPLGVYACLGNHDYEDDPELVVCAFEQVGIPMLINTHRRLQVGCDALWLLGVDSAREGRPALDRALDGVPPDGFKVLLAHEPDFADRVPPSSIHLQLSGHSHGGQIVVPSVPVRWLPRLGKKYPRGLYRVGDMVLYTNRGLGAGVLPLRHNCPPEITVIQLQRG
ncbi:MAG: metallophosphoesterase [Anaerolineae bacterium]